MPRKFQRRNLGRRRYKRKIVPQPVMKSKIAKIQRGPFSRWNSINPFPVNYNCKFVYCAEGTLTSSSTLNLCGDTEDFRLNSPYDPYFGTGVITKNTSCSGYSKLLSATGPYLRYKTHSIKIDLLFYNPSHDGVAGVAFIKGASSSFDPNGQDMQMLDRMPMCTVKRLNDTGSQRRKIVQYMSLSSLYGFNANQFKNEVSNTTSQYNSNPATSILLRLGVASANPLITLPATMQYKLNLTFYTQCYDRVEVATAESPI